MTLTTIGWVLVYSGLIGLAAIGLCRVIDLAGFWLAVLVDRWDRRADRDIRAHIDQAVDGLEPLTPAAAERPRNAVAGLSGVGPDVAGSGPTSPTGPSAPRPLGEGAGADGPAPPRVLMLDEDAAHQIRLYFLSGSGKIAVSCACTWRRHRGGEYFKAATLLPADEALAAYRRHLEAVAG